MIPVKFIPYDIPHIEQRNSASGRLYITPDKKAYPSVTTVLGIESAVYLTEWRDKVGHAVADEISRKAAARGTKVHAACEQYLEGKKYTWNVFDENTAEMFSYLVPTLDSIQEVHALETRLYSDMLETAGTVDLIAKVDGEMTIIDWKTSGRFKTRDDIHGYFAQCAFYAHAFFERTGVIVPNITVAMSVEDYGQIIFREKVKEWLPVFMKTRQKFRALKGY